MRTLTPTIQDLVDLADLGLLPAGHPQDAWREPFTALDGTRFDFWHLSRECNPGLTETRQHRVFDLPGLVAEFGPTGTGRLCPLCVTLDPPELLADLGLSDHQTRSALRALVAIARGPLLNPATATTKDGTLDAYADRIGDPDPRWGHVTVEAYAQAFLLVHAPELFTTHLGAAAAAAARTLAARVAPALAEFAASREMLRLRAYALTLAYGTLATRQLLARRLRRGSRTTELKLPAGMWTPPQEWSTATGDAWYTQVATDLAALTDGPAVWIGARPVPDNRNLESLLDSQHGETDRASALLFADAALVANVNDGALRPLRGVYPDERGDLLVFRLPATTWAWLAHMLESRVDPVLTDAGYEAAHVAAGLALLRPGDDLDQLVQLAPTLLAEPA